MHYSALNADVVRVYVRDTYLAIIKETDGGIMRSTSVDLVLRGARVDIQRMIAQYGGDTPLLENYSYTYQRLRIEAWQYMSEEEYKVTHNTILDMITGLEQNLHLHLDDTECRVDLRPIIEGEPRGAGHGLIHFADDPRPNTQNGTTLSPSLSSNATLTDYRVQTQVHDTFMTIQMAGQFRKLPEGVTARLLAEAYQDVRHQIVHFGGETQLSEAYEYTYQGLTLAAFSHGSPRETKYKVTYIMVLNMITGLRENLRRINEVECTIDLAKKVGARIYPAGSGLLGYPDDTSLLSLNGTVPASSNGTNGTLVGLGADEYEFRVPGTNTLLIIRKAGSKSQMPVLETLQLLSHATADLETLMREHGVNARLINGEFVTHHDNFVLEAHEPRIPQVPLTYDIVQDMVTGLKDCFWRLNYVESTVDIYRLGQQSVIQVGSGILSPEKDKTLLPPSNVTTTAIHVARDLEISRPQHRQSNGNPQRP